MSAQPMGRRWSRGTIMARVWLGVALLSGVTLVLIVAATTELFEPADIGVESYQVGFGAGWADSSTPDADVLAGRADAALGRGTQAGSTNPGARLIVAMLEMHIAHTATALGGPFDQGFEAGRADALAGLPSEVSGL